MLKWGIVCTTNAPAEEVLAFLAYHLRLGAHRIWLFLDAPQPALAAYLSEHDQIELITTGADYWSKRREGRPDRHQFRQIYNATRILRRAKEVDWLAHIDVDEFIIARHGPSPAAVLATLPGSCTSMRIKPIEALSPSQGARTYFKALPSRRGDWARIAQEIYPEFHDHLRLGFCSHVEGKQFARTFQPKSQFKIHRVFYNGVESPKPVTTPLLELGHFHARSWQIWAQKFDFRLQQGAYRAELFPIDPAHPEQPSVHMRLSLLAQEGTEKLKRFFDETQLDSPQLRDRLEKHNLLRSYALGCSDAVKNCFPDAAERLNYSAMD